MKWMMDDMRLQRPMPWFAPRPPLHFGPGLDMSPMNSLRDFIQSFANQSVRLDGDHLFHHAQFHANRRLPIPPPPRRLNKPQRARQPTQQQYEVLHCIGRGGYGYVCDARRKSDRSSVVMKFLPRDRILNWGTLDGVGHTSIAGSSP